MASFPPTLRLKRRYLLIEGSRGSVEKAIMEYIGILGWAKAAPMFLPASNGMCILAINREEINNARAALALSADEIDVLRVSGTLKGLKIHGSKKHKT